MREDSEENLEKLLFVFQLKTTGFLQNLEVIMRHKL